ncbi:MAG: DUF4625 domain-containing protein [Tannerellaceae bacterium]|nr:DUF4625 domain-containing protein [Tannerellaceae bacterium]
MKTNNFLFYILSFVLATFFLSACDKDDESNDTSAPEIELLAPAEGAHLQIGKAIHFEANFSDNIMLGSYKIAIHDNFDNHGHGSKSDTEESTAFEYFGTWSLEGQKNAYIHQHDITIPEKTIPGDYHMLVYCTDKAGNETYVVRNIILTNEEVEDLHH